MCGFIGILNLNENNNEDKNKLNQINYLLKHRGPDNSDTLSLGSCTLSHTRLSIIDLSQAGNQPMTDEEKKIIIAYNGEVYNFENLKKK